jgi:outer membrane lipoprotein carrier protein
LCLFFSAPVQAAGNNALEALETLRRGFAGINDFTADVVQEKQLALMKKKMVSKGQVRFKKPDLFFMELLAPHASRLTLRANVMTLWLPEQGEIQRVVLPPENGLDKWLAYLDKPVSEAPEGVDLKAEQKNNIWTLRVSPLKKTGMKELQLSFDMKGQISRIVIAENNGDRTDIKFSNLRRNVGLKDKDLVQDSVNRLTP